MKRIVMMAVFMVLAAALLAFSAENKKEPFAVVTSEEVKAMIDRQEPGLILIDARTPQEFQEVHIKGAVNLPLPVLEKNPAALTFSKDATLVFYCNGFKCGKSPKAARLAASLGYVRLSVLSEGMPAWEEKGFAIYAGPDYEKKIETSRIAPRELQKILTDTPTAITLVDVRDANEYADGHIPGAVNIPASNFATLSSGLEKDKKIVVYCNSGGRSYNAYRKLKKMAFGDIAQAIFTDWQEIGLPVSKGLTR
ncbi:MAG: rhodanese-like domain-containing protein [Desulfuromonadales bacterium]